MSLEAVHRHYQDQLARVGWQCSGSGRTAWVAWSAWAFQDAHGIPRRALLIILRRPRADGTYDWSLTAGALDRRELAAEPLVDGSTQAAVRDAQDIEVRLLYELARRLIAARLVHAGPASGVPDAAPQIFLGRLHRAFVPALPLLGGRVAGSVLHGGAGIAVVESGLSRSLLLGFFREYLIAAGWRMVPSAVPSFGGFIRPPLPDTRLCFARDSAMLELRLWPAGSGTLVRADMKAMDHPEALQRRITGARPAAPLLPRLVPLPRATIITGSAICRAAWQRSNTSLHMDADLRRVSTHYAEQLRLAGWNMKEAAQDDLLAWHSWTFRDRTSQDWQALFCVLRRPDVPGSYVLELEATRVGGNGVPGGCSTPGTT
jgi:hypothetical protein